MLAGKFPLHVQQSIAKFNDDKAMRPKTPKPQNLKTSKPKPLLQEMFPDYPRHVQQSIAKFNDDETLGPDLALVEALICHICCGKGAGRSPRALTAHDRHLGPMRPLRDMAPEGAVLVFLTGWEDIQDLMDLLRKNPRLSRLEGQGRVQIMALHGQMPGKSQVGGGWLS